MTATSQSIAPVYVVMGGELLLGAPISKAYPHVRNYPRWQNYSRVEHVSGPAGGAGELVILRKEEKGFTFPPYYARTILIEPERRLIWKTYPADEGKEGDFFGIVDFKLWPVDSKTCFEYNAIYEFQVPYLHLEELERFREEQTRNFQALFDAVFPKLEELCIRET
jgi:hypothetical protein